MCGDNRMVGEQKEVTGLTKDGRPLVIELMLNSMPDENGGRTFVGVLHDITGVSMFFTVDI